MNLSDIIEPSDPDIAQCPESCQKYIEQLQDLCSEQEKIIKNLMHGFRDMSEGHRAIYTNVCEERNEADRRAGAAWRLVSRYKKKVRELNQELGRD